MKKFLNFLKQNYIPIIYVVLAIFFELLGLFACEGTWRIKNPWFAISLLGIFTCIICLFRSQKLRHLLAVISLLVQGGIILFSIILYDMTGTIFDYAMLNLRNDAMGILESVPINMTFLGWFLFLFLSFTIAARRFTFRIQDSSFGQISRIVKGFLILILLGANAGIAYGLDSNEVSVDYTTKLEKTTTGQNSNLGITGNLVNAFYKGLLYNEKSFLTDSEITAFLESGGMISSSFTDSTAPYGISQGKNVVTILVESFEWYSFVSDLSKYPNGIQTKEGEELTPEQIAYLFPNLVEFYNMSSVMTNNYAREKTDISEMQSLLGSYPTDCYLDYDYPKNTYSNSIINLIKKDSASRNEDIITTYFHDSFGSYYNRNKIMPSIGFDSRTVTTLNANNQEVTNTYPIIDSNVMYTLGMTNASETTGDRNLDSEMMQYTKELMFPTDRRFYSHITTLTMHGMYGYRENLSEYYEKFSNTDVFGPEGILQGDTMDKEHLRNYVACVMDFDKAIGIMLQYLRDNSLLDNTIIVMFGDHNTYYHGLSNYVKDIHTYSDEPTEDNNNDYYTMLYNVPLMIYDSNIPHQIITKFTTTNDIVPTLMNLLGIDNYRNLYFGNSVYQPEESILYSRAYTVFLTDKLYFYSMNDIKFKRFDTTDEYLDDFTKRAKKHLIRLQYIDQIVYGDYFSRN